MNPIPDSSNVLPRHTSLYSANGIGANSIPFSSNGLRLFPAQKFDSFCFILSKFGLTAVFATCYRIKFILIRHILKMRGPSKMLRVYTRSYIATVGRFHADFRRHTMYDSTNSPVHKPFSATNAKCSIPTGCLSIRPNKAINTFVIDGPLKKGPSFSNLVPKFAKLRKRIVSTYCHRQSRQITPSQIAYIRSTFNSGAHIYD